MSHKREFPKIPIPSTNDIHRESLIQHMKEGTGRKLLAINSSFPFLFIGTILDVVDDFIIVEVETTPVQELETRQWYIHIDQIELFFIELETGPKIPELGNNYSS